MKILVAVDGSEAALAAARHALRLRREGLRASYLIANVQEHATLYEMVVAHDPKVLEKVTAAAGAHLLDSAAALFDAEGVPVERECVSGEPAPMLIEIAERYRCAAIVMGARGMGALRGALVGSVSQQVLQRARVPVTIVAPDDPDASD